MGRKPTFGTTSEGKRKRDLGWKENNGRFVQHRFYPSGDRSTALLREHSLQMLWDCVEGRWTRAKMDGLVSSSRPIWTPNSLAMGLAICKGEPTITIHPQLEGELGCPGDDSEALLLWWATWCQDFGGLKCFRMTLAQQQAKEAEAEAERKVKEAEAAESYFQTFKVGSQSGTLGQVFDAYSAWVTKTYRSTEEAGKPSVRGNNLLRQVATLKSHHAEVLLGELDGNKITELCQYWCNRPSGKKVARYSKNMSYSLARTLKRILFWTEGQNFRWRLPKGYRFPVLKVIKTDTERAQLAGKRHVDTFTLEDLCNLWKYADPVTRVFILLGLNCGFGPMEIRTLQEAERFTGIHPHYSKDGNFIFKIRKKSGVYGEWRLWPETVAGLEWYKTVRHASDTDYLFIKRNGKAMVSTTSGGNPCDDTRWRWDGIYQRAEKDGVTIKYLPFKFLRKTASTLLRKICGGELTKIFLCHGSPVGDNLMDVYADRPFSKTFRATRLMRKKLLPMLRMFDQPFDKDSSPVSKRIAVSKVAEIKKLRAEGNSYQKVADLVGVGVSTVKRYCK